MTLLQAQGGGGMSMLFMMIILFAIMYFMMIRPEKKRQKKAEEARNALKPGDKVMTHGGLFGILREVNKDSGQVVVEVWEGVKVRTLLNFISPVGTTTEEEKK